MVLPHLHCRSVAALPSTLQHVGLAGAPVLGHTFPYMPALPLQLPEKKNTIRLETQLKDPKIQIIFYVVYVQGVLLSNCMPIDAAHFVQLEGSL